MEGTLESLLSESAFLCEMLIMGGYYGSLMLMGLGYFFYPSIFTLPEGYITLLTFRSIPE